MPELPDVENFTRYLKRHGLDKRIEAVTVTAPRILKGLSAAALDRALKGRKLESARRHGKHLLAAVDDGHWLAFHFGLTGRLEHFERGAADPEHDRLRLDFAGGEHLAFVNQRLLGHVEWAEDADAFIRAKKLGPDALALTESAFCDAMRTKRGTVKAALMDQSLVAGIGNIYSDEILYHAKLHPRTPTGDLDDKALHRLYRQLRRVLHTAVNRGAGAEDIERRVPRTWLLPHRRKGAECPRCGGKIAALKVQSRTAYYCPRCQPAPKSRRG
jgi:formamidopyrimidine-DNA glycosylase